MKKIILIIVLCSGMLAYYSIIQPSSVLAQISADKASKLADTDFISVKNLNSMLSDEQGHLVLLGVSKGTVALDLGDKLNVNSYTVWRSDYIGDGSTEAISKEVAGFRKSKSEMENLLSKAGVTADSIIVIYSEDGMHDATRLYWQLKQLGHKNIKILDGGLKAWVAAGYPVGEAKKLVDEEIKSAYKAASYNTKEWGVTIGELITALNHPEQWVVIDTRSQGEFEGQKRASADIYGTGGLKGAVNIEWTNSLNSDNTLKSKEELQAIYGEVIKGKKVILLCHSGVRSAHSQIVIKEMLGKDDVYSYDGAWIEWSYVASEASRGVVDGGLKSKVKELTTNWTDNKK